MTVVVVVATVVVALNGLRFDLHFCWSSIVGLALSDCLPELPEPYLTLVSASADASVRLWQRADSRADQPIRCVRQVDTHGALGGVCVGVWWAACGCVVGGGRRVGGLCVGVVWVVSGVWWGGRSESVV